MAAPASAEIIYNVTNDLPHQSNWSLAGTITVSGAGTFNDASAVTAWDITASKTGSPSHRYSNVLSDASVLSAGTLEATASDLKLGGGSFLIFYATLPDVGDASMSQLRWVNNSDSSVYTGKWAGTDLWLSEANSANAYSPSVGGLWTVASGGTPSPDPVPEIDPATGGSALSLVAGVLAIIEQRRRRAMLVA
jgi:hypothetical protein